MAVSAFTVANIKPALSIDGGIQRFIFGLPEAPEPLAGLKLDTLFVPVVDMPSKLKSEFRNNTFSGFRFLHTTEFGQSFGTFRLQSFVNAEETGTDLWIFNQDGSITFAAPTSFQNLVITGDLDFQGYRGTNVGDPVDDGDLVNKAWVNAAITGSIGGSITLTGDVTGSGVTGTPFATTFTKTLNQITNAGNIALSGFKITGAADPTNPQDLTTQNFVNNKTWLSSQITDFATAVNALVDTQFGPNVTLPFTGLNFNWSNPSNPFPGANIPYVITNTLSDTDTIYKRLSWVVKAADIQRYFTFDYALGDQSTPSPSFTIKFTHPLGSPTTTTPFNLFSTPVGSAASWKLYLDAILDVNNKRIINVGAPIDGTDAINRDFLQTYVPTVRLDQFAVPTAAINLNSQLLNAVSSLGIGGNAVGTGRITFSNVSSQKKITLYDASGTDSDYDYNGFGSNGANTIYNCRLTYNHLFQCGDTLQALRVTKTALYTAGLLNSTDFLKVIMWYDNTFSNQLNSSYGVGVQGSSSSIVLRHQIGNTTGKFAWFSGNSNSYLSESLTSTELMNLSGTGVLSFPATIAKKISLFSSLNTASQYYGFGVGAGALQYFVDQTSSDHVFYAATGAATQNELFRAKGTGDTVTAGTIYGRRAGGMLSWQGNASTTTITTANTYYKVVISNAYTTLLNQFASYAAGRLDYISTTPGTFFIQYNVCAVNNSGSVTEQTFFRVYKNGLTPINQSTSYAQNMHVAGCISGAAVISLSEGDYIELWATHNVSGRNVSGVYGSILISAI